MLSAPLLLLLPLLERLLLIRHSSSRLAQQALSQHRPRYCQQKQPVGSRHQS
jgi:hypothetical protein